MSRPPFLEWAPAALLLAALTPESVFAAQRPVSPSAERAALPSRPDAERPDAERPDRAAPVFSADSTPDGAVTALPGAANELWPRAEGSAGAVPDDSVIPMAPKLGQPGERLEFLTGVDRHYARGRTYKAWLGKDGFTYVPFFGSDAPRSWPLTMKVASVTVGDDPLDLGDAALPSRQGQRMAMSRGPVTSRYDFALESVEQSFVIETGSRTGELVVELTIESDLRLDWLEGGANFGCPEGYVHHGAAYVLAPSGVETPIQSTYTAKTVRFTVPAWLVAEAGGRIVVDPVLFTFDVDNFSGSAQRDPDVSYDVATDSFTYVYEDVFSGMDRDIYRTTLSPTGGPVSAGYVSVAPEDEGRPSISNLASVGEHLIVAEQRQSDGFTEVVGWTFDPVASSASVEFTVADTGSGTNRWTNRRPDTGGNMSTASDSRYCVVWEREFQPGDTRVRYATVDGLGNPSFPFALDFLSGSQIDGLSISKSTGDPSVNNRWNLAWDRELSSGSHEIRGAQLTGSGGLVAPVETLYSFGASEFAVSVDVSDSIALDGLAPTYLVVFDALGGTQEDVTALLCRDGSRVNNIVIEELEHALPNVDEDAVRVSTTFEDFVVGYQTRLSGGDYEATITCLDLTEGLYLAVSERRTVVGTAFSRGVNDIGDFMCMASRWSGGLTASRFVGLGWSSDFGSDGLTEMAGALHFADNGQSPAFQYCLGTANSTGDRGFLRLVGDRTPTASKVATASALPPSQFALLLSGTNQASFPGTGGAGTLCLGGTLGRYNSSISAIESGGVVSFDVDPTAIPLGPGPIAATAGTFMQWQVWHRDVVSGTATSNFTNAVTILFR